MVQQEELLAWIKTGHIERVEVLGPLQGTIVLPEIQVIAGMAMATIVREPSGLTIGLWCQELQRIAVLEAMETTTLQGAAQIVDPTEVRAAAQEVDQVEVRTEVLEEALVAQGP